MEYKKINMPGLLHGGDYNPEQWLDRPDILRGYPVNEISACK